MDKFIVHICIVDAIVTSATIVLNTLYYSGICPTEEMFHMTVLSLCLAACITMYLTFNSIMLCVIKRSDSRVLPAVPLPIIHPSPPTQPQQNNKGADVETILVTVDRNLEENEIMMCTSCNKVVIVQQP